MSLEKTIVDKTDEKYAIGIWNKFTRINTMKRMEWLILEKIIHVCVFYIHLQYIIVGNTFNNTMCSSNKSNIPFTTIANMKPKCQQRLKMIEKHMLNEYF